MKCDMVASPPLPLFCFQTMAAPRLIRDSLPAFNLSDDQVLKKVFLSQLSSALALPPSFQTEGIVAQVNQSFFALPFLHQERGNKSIDTIARRLRENGYSSTNEVGCWCWVSSRSGWLLELLTELKIAIYCP